MDEKKIKKQKSQVIFSILAFTLLFFMEMYAIINYKDNFILSGVIVVAALVVLYILVNGIIDMAAVINKKNEEQYENILKSEKAAYILQKKNFAQMEQRMIHGEKAALIPTEEIVNAQKGIAKIIVGRNKENAEAIMRANELLVEEFHKLKNDIYSDNSEFMNEEKANRVEVTQQILDRQQQILTNLHEFMSEEKINRTELTQQMLMDIKDMELRLNSEIMRSQNMISEQKSLLQQPIVQQVPIMQPIQQPVVEQAPLSAAESKAMAEPSAAVNSPITENVPEEPAVEDVIELLDDASEATVDEFAGDDLVLEQLKMDDEIESDIEEDSITDEIGELGIDIIEDSTSEEDTTPIVDISNIDLSDPDREMSMNEVDALIASIGEDIGTTISEESITELENVIDEITTEQEVMAEEAAIEEATVEPEAVAEEATIEEASAEPETVVEEATVEETVVEPEAVVEEAAAEEPKAPEIDLSDPNKKMSPDDIAALFATMGADTGAAEESASEPEEASAEPEAVAEEPKAPEIDLSDPNKKMSPDDIAALFAAMG